MDVSGEQNPISEHSYAAPERQPNARENQRAEVVIAAPASRELTRSIWRKRDLVSPNLFSWYRSDFKRRKEFGHQERIYYKVELGKKRSKEARIEHRHQGIEQIIGRRRGGGGRARGTNRTNRRPTQVSRRVVEPVQEEESTQEDGADDDEDDVEFHHSASGGNETSLDESDLESGDSSSGSSSEYSDWGANNLTPPQRTARKSERTAVSSKPASSDEEVTEATSQADTSINSIISKPGPSRIAKSTKKNYSFNPSQLDDIPPEYLPSDWLAQYVPNKSPYFPQMGDEVMYVKQGHIGYINLVKNRESYRLNMREQQWLHREDIKDIGLVKVRGV